MIDYIGSKNPKLKKYIDKYGYIRWDTNEDIFFIYHFSYYRSNAFQ